MTEPKPHIPKSSRLKGRLVRPEESRLSGDLYAKWRARLLGETAILSEAKGTSIVSEALPGVTGKAEEKLSVFDGRATLVVGADILGLWHYSPGSISQFTRDKAERSGGKFGHGTYFGVGELTGETVDALRGGGSLRHDAGFTGNILALDRDQVRDIVATLRSLNGIPAPDLKTNIQNGPVTDLVEGIAFDGRGVDAVMVYMGPKRQAAEMIVLPSATRNINLLPAA